MWSITVGIKAGLVQYIHESLALDGLECPDPLDVGHIS